MSQTIFTSIAQHADKHPEAVAIEALGREALSFRRLCDHILSVVETLNGVGVGRGDRVAIVLPPGPEMATASLAVMAGAVAAPLNHDYKTGEYQRFLADLTPSLLLAQGDRDSPAKEAAHSLGIPIMELSAADGSQAGLFSLSTEAARARATQGGLSDSGDLALVLHTSGTTSRPRTVPLTQRNLWGSVRNLSESLELGPDDRCLQLLPLFHIGGFIDTLASPLAAGGRVVCTPGFSVPAFFECLEVARPTWSQAVPTMLQEILEHAEARRDAIAGNSLRLMRSVSAALPIPVMEAFERTFDTPVIEIYGMTETAGLITSNPLANGPRKPGSVGLPAGPDVGIADDTGTLQPTNQRGEIVVRGGNVMAGYENAPDDNATAFFGPWFRTGDQGHMDEDGYLFLTGRLKEVINRGGEKISPQEVDAVLATHPAVAESATFGLPHQSLGEDVAAAVVLKEGAQVSKQDLIEFLSLRLAYFKVPRVVNFVHQIPKTPGGKLRRNQLAEILGRPREEPAADQPEQPSRPAQSPVEKTLAEMWARVLDIPQVGVHDDFFDLGGDSLKAASFINELQQKWGDTVYVSALFDAPSVAKFESYLGDRYPELVARMLGHSVSPGEIDSTRKVTSAKMQELRESIVRIAGPQEPRREKNAPAIFILATPRSGSTLLRVMLGGHSRLFAPPELFLLSFDNLGDRKHWFEGSQRFHLEGNIRAVMQLKNQGLEEVQNLVENFEEQKLPTQDYYRMMQDWLGEQVLVDKTPFYTAHGETLRRAEQYFRDAIYIHLLRHPYGMIRSFEEARMDELWYPRFVGGDEALRTPFPYSRGEFAEMIWLLLHENIGEFLKGVPSQRQYRVKFEDLVQEPRQTLDQLCGFLGLELEPEMLQPQGNAGERMTDGLHPGSRMMGDMKFHEHVGIDADVADHWKQHYQADFLSDLTWQLAASFGYDETVAMSKGRTEFEI